MTVQTPLRVIPINGKRAAYALAGELRKAGAVASVCRPLKVGGVMGSKRSKGAQNKRACRGRHGRSWEE